MLIPAFLVAVIVVALFAARRPLPVFLGLTFLFTVGYLRTGIQLAASDGQAISLYLGDVVWAALVIGIMLRWCRNPHLTVPSGRAPWEMWAMAPYLFLGILLPLAGVALVGSSAQHATTALRHAQWLSFALLAYQFARSEPLAAGGLGRKVLVVVVVAGGVHVSYALVQLVVWLGLLGESWVALDLLYQAQHASSWFYYPRLTGLLVNPNSFGVFGAFLLVLAAGRLYVRRGARDGLFLAALGAGLFAVVFSASRSALAGLVGGGLVVTLTLVHRPRRLVRWAAGSTLAVAAAAAAFLMAWPVVPAVIRDRYMNILEVTEQGVAADRGMADRTEMWSELIARYWTEFPLGSLVSPIFATDQPIDSYYLLTALQGTPAYMILLVTFFVAAAALARRCYWALDNDLTFSAIVFAGWTGVIAGASLGLSPMLQEHLVAPYYALLGVLIAAVRPRRGTVPSAERRSDSSAPAPALVPRQRGAYREQGDGRS